VIVPLHFFDVLLPNSGDLLVSAEHIFGLKYFQIAFYMKKSHGISKTQPTPHGSLVFGNLIRINRLFRVQWHGTIS
jgi:hypothetical protein